MFASGFRQDFMYRMMTNLPVVGNHIISFWLNKNLSKNTRGLDIQVSQLTTNYCEARLKNKSKPESNNITGQSNMQLAQLCELTASACYSYTHHQRLEEKLKRWNIEILKPIQGDLVAIAEINYGCLSGVEAKPTTLNVEVLDIEGDQVAYAEFLLTSRPITRE